MTRAGPGALSPRRPRGLIAAALVVLLAAWGGPVRAQVVWVPIGSRLDQLVAWAVDGGAFAASLDPLARPWRFGAVRDALTREDTTLLAPATRRAVADVARELARTEAPSALIVTVGMAAYNHGRRDSFRPGGASGVAPSGGVWAALGEGPFSVVINPAIDNRLRDDPEWYGFTQRVVAGRLQTGYVAAAGPHADVSLGRMERNWGPDLFEGLLVSPSVYAIDELSASLRISRFELSTLQARLDNDTVLGGTPADPFNRYYFAHRLGINLGRGSWLALVESGIYGGRGQGFQPAFLAPVNLGLLSEVNENLKVNTLLSAEALVRIRGALTIAGSLMLDDFQIDRKTLSDSLPASYGFTVQLRDALPNVPVHVALGYTRVSALAYRNVRQPSFAYDFRSVGLARNFSDYDQVLVRLESRPAPGLYLGLDAQYLRQGAGDFRQPFPSDTLLAQGGYGFLIAPVARVAGIRFVASDEVWPGFELHGQVGATGRPGGKPVAILELAGTVSLDLLTMSFGSPWRGVGSTPGEWP